MAPFRPSLAIYLTLALSLAGCWVSAWGTDTEDITYILPIYEGALASDVRSDDITILKAMKSKIGTGGSKTKLGFSFSSWSLSRDIKSEADDYVFDPTNLNYVLGLAKELSLPILVHANNGRWADCCTSNSDGGWNTALLNHIAAAGNTTQIDSSGKSLYGSLFGSNYFSFSRHNSLYRSYKKRNVQASMKVLVAWAAENPSLFVGVSLDSETIFPNINADYNPLIIQEWREWLQHSGIYGPSGDYFGQGRKPAFTSISQFNQATGKSFSSWDSVVPPTTFTAGDPFCEEWHRWRLTLVENIVGDTTAWIAEAGVPRYKIFGHQTPEIDFYGFADDFPSAVAAHGGAGLTMYGRSPADMGSANNPVRGMGSNNVGNFELNPLTSDANTAYDTILTLYNDGYKIACPNAYEVVAKPDQYSLFGSPNFGDTWGNAIAKFISTFANTARNLQPPPWNPGENVYDLYDNFDSAVKSGPDNSLAANGSTGNMSRKTIFSHVGGKITYTTKLPSVSTGQRLNFWTSVGIRDGAGSGGDASFQVKINGNALFGSNGLILPKNYWIWKRWLPAMVDVTPWAGTDVTIELTTTGSATYGWTQWGAPAFYASVNDLHNNLALNKAVKVSSEDGRGAGWDAAYLTDGNVVGGTDGRNGWSSASHSTPDAEEWAQVDLGSSKPVSKVVLHPRGDLTTAAGSGFPTAFRIEGSTDGQQWTVLSAQTDYGATIRAGHAEIFPFMSRSVRYVRVVGTELSGVADESGYRMQFTEMEVYA
ncbi:hypothetical protein BGZ63DRAFT_425266 [Mariannaea sp. PMI_226]|nr:hypothetical protein BGZ63DRAFT_425266 [Mariannaea sp. PMI_226]